jgi:hypothetical protein
MGMIRKMAVFWGVFFTLSAAFGQSKVAFLESEGKNTGINSKNLLTSTSAIPFVKAGNLLLVNAELGAKSGVFILDTGAPTLVINYGGRRKQIPAQGVTGSLMVEDTLLKQFRWNNTEWNNINGLTVDMKHFEDVSSRDLKGLIGYEILKNFDMVVDPTSQTIELFSSRKNLSYNPDQVLTTIPMVQQDHLPIIEVQINGKKVLLGIDTGAEINFLDQRLVSGGELGQSEAIGSNLIKGLDNNEKRNQKLLFDSVTVGGIVMKDQVFAIADLSKLFPTSNGLKIQGLVGNAFLNQFRYSMNYRRGTFSIINFVR